MALATTCPQCKTSFKVVPDQLKLRRGLVRCGVCQHVFSGIDYLRYVDDAARAAQRAARERAASGASPGPGATEGPGAASVATPPDAPVPSMPQRDAPAPAATARADARPDDATTAPSTARPSAVPPSEPAAFPPSAPAAFPPSEPPTVPSTAPAAGNMPSDPWAAAAAIAHERSLRDDGADRAATSAPADGSVDTRRPVDRPPPPLAGDAAPTPAAPASGDDTGRGAPHDARPPEPPWARPAAGPAPSSHESPAPVAAATPSRPALPAPEAPRVPLDDLLARPAAPWPPAAGPQTVIAADDDLKTAFFLTDSAFGPLPGETSDVMPPTSIHRAGTHAGAVTRVHGESPTGSPDPTSAPPPVAAQDAARAAAPDAAQPVARGAAPALPGLPLRPERGMAEDVPEASPAVVPTPFEPLPRRIDPPPAPAIDYHSGGHRRSRSLGLALSPAAWAAAIGLSLLLGLQAVVGWRDAIAARVPLVAPTLAGVLGPFGLRVGPPRELDALTIEGFELQAAGVPNVLALSAVLRNRSAHVVGYPAMELTLTDSGGALIVRKVIPADLYVGDPATIEAGLAARSERPVRLALQHDGLQPTGFAVALFYP